MASGLGKKTKETRKKPVHDHALERTGTGRNQARGHKGRREDRDSYVWLPSTKLSGLFSEAVNRGGLGCFQGTLRGQGNRQAIGDKSEAHFSKRQGLKGRPTFCDIEADTAVNKVIQVDGPLLER